MTTYKSNHATYGITYTVTGSPDVLKASMKGAGPLLVPAEGWMAKVPLANVPISTSHPNYKETDMATWIFVFEGAMKPESEVSKQPIPWWTSLDRCAQFMGDLHATKKLEYKSMSMEEARNMVFEAAKEMPPDKRARSRAPTASATTTSSPPRATRPSTGALASPATAS